MATRPNLGFSSFFFELESVNISIKKFMGETHYNLFYHAQTSVCKCFMLLCISRDASHHNLSGSVPDFLSPVQSCTFMYHATILTWLCISKLCSTEPLNHLFVKKTSADQSGLVADTKVCTLFYNIMDALMEAMDKCLVLDGICCVDTVCQPTWVAPDYTFKILKNRIMQSQFFFRNNCQILSCLPTARFLCLLT